LASIYWYLTGYRQIEHDAAKRSIETDAKIEYAKELAEVKYYSFALEEL